MKTKKLLFPFILIVLLACNAGTALASESSVWRYIITADVRASLNISSSGVATCSGKVIPIDETVICEITTTLKQKINGNWIELDSWSNTDINIYGVRASGTYSVAKGTYKVTVNATLTADDGTTEDVYAESSEKTY